MTPEEKEEEVICEARNRQIYDPVTKVFNYSKRRVTDLPENNRVTLPKETTPKIENELGMLREIVMREFHKLKGELEEDEKRRKVPVEKRKNQEGRNLTKQQREGLKKLKKRIGDKIRFNLLVCTERLQK